MLFLLCAGLFFYILFGYPVLLYFLVRWQGRPVQAGPEQKSVSIIIPVHNGAPFLRRKLDSIQALNYPKELLEVLVVSDGSTDNTREVALEYAAQGVHLLSIPRSGKAAALNSAVPRVSGEILVLTDVRQDLHRESLELLVRAFHDPQVGVASGELILRQGTTHDEADVGLYWKYESWIRRNLSQLDSMFGATGPFYALRRTLFTPIPEDILLDDMYLPMSIFFRNYRLVVEPRALAYDYPMTRQREFGRKVRTLGGNYQILLRMPRLLSFSNRLWWHFVSYKVGRLLLPWLCLAILLATVRLPFLPKAIFASLQCFFYLAAFFDPYVPPRAPLKKISSPARTFVVLMAATLKGLSVLFVPARSLWKVTDIPSDS
jgi:poly-beta-1,6-N-acetyl-D-glucosamine synthase